MMKGSCHCGAVQIKLARKPRRLTSCNCSICRRYSALWAYYDRAQVKILAGKAATAGYSWGDKQIRFVRCATCGCVINWQYLDRSKTRVGVNVSNFEPADIASIRVRRLDGAKTWKFL